MTQKYEEEDIRRRVFAAWFRKSKALGSATPTGCELVVLEGLRYAVLHAGVQVLAVYRVRNTGQLKYLTRPPKVFGVSP